MNGRSMNTEQSNYRDVEAYILNIPKFTKKNTPEDTDDFYTFLGRPGERQKIIHVAGTNGKGSVCTYAEAMIMATGHTCGLFTSPHLVCMRERIRVQQQDIPENAFLSLFARLKEKLCLYGRAYHPTFFEFLFFMAMMWFEETGVEYIILETGLGGRLDATNVVHHKEACIITKIAMDHTEYLGSSIEEIAGEKAGIITGNAPVFYYDVGGKAENVIRERAFKMEAPIYELSHNNIQNIKKHQNFIDFSVSFKYYGNYNIKVSSCALYQCMNASLALYAMRVLLGQALTQEIAATAIAGTSWPCRMEEILPGILLDGAHNPDGVEALLESLVFRPENKILLFAVVKDKDIDAMVDRITGAEIFDQYILTAVGGARAADLSYVEERFRRETDREIVVIQDPGEAFSYGRKIQGERLLVVAGSLYLTGWIRGLCKEEK